VITCRDLVDFLMDWHSGRLPASQKAEFERHLKGCPPCIDYLKTYEATVALGKAACCEEDASCEDVPEQLVKAILAARKAKPRP